MGAALMLQSTLYPLEQRGAGGYPSKGKIQTLTLLTNRLELFLALSSRARTVFIDFFGYRTICTRSRSSLATDPNSKCPQKRHNTETLTGSSNMEPAGVSKDQQRSSQILGGACFGGEKSRCFGGEKTWLVSFMSSQKS